MYEGQKPLQRVSTGFGWLASCSGALTRRIKSFDASELDSWHRVQPASKSCEETGRFRASRSQDQGAVAQLGERLICIQEVIGSIPIGSTNPLCCKAKRAKWVGSSGG